MNDASHWDEVAKIMTNVMQKDLEGSYKGEVMKTFQHNNEVIEVIFKNVTLR